MSTVLLLHFDGPDGSTTFTDSSGHSNTPTPVAGGISIDTAYSQFGSASCLFTGGTNGLQLSGQPDFAFGTGDFTIDYRIKLNTIPSVIYYIYDGRFLSEGPFPTIYIDSSGTVNYFTDTGGPHAFSLASTTILAPAGFYHIEVTRASGVTRLFVNGNLEASGADTCDYVNSNSTRPIIGGSAVSNLTLDGWLDEFRVVRGYATNTASFTPPFGPYSQDVIDDRAPLYSNPKAPLQPDRTWTWSYNLNLIGQDRMVAGEQFSERPPLGPLQPLRSWTWSYNLNLIGQDQLPTGEQSFELPPLGYLYPASLRTWIGTKTREVVVTLPNNQYDWPLTPAAGQLPRSWVWSYNLNLIGQDVLPTGEQRTDLPPKGYEYAASLRTWIQNLLFNTLQPLPYGAQIYDLSPRGPQQPLRSWTWQYNLNLIGQDQLPVGERIFDLPVPPTYPTGLRTWISSVNIALTIQPPSLPNNQYDWPTPKGYIQPDRTWTWTYNLNLIGQDQLPSGEQVTDLPPKAYPEPATRSWYSWYNLNLIGQDRLPIGDQIFELPSRGYLHPQQTRTWTSWYNLNLIGQDLLPVGEQIFALPPTGYIYPNDVRTWINQVNLALITQAAILPKNQYDWPTPKAYQQAAQSWTWSYNLNLIGKDQLPVGEQVSDLSPRGAQYPTELRTWIQRVNLLINGLGPFPKNQYDWPTPKDYQQPLRSWTWSYNLNLIGKDKMVAGQQYYDLPPKGPQQPQRSAWVNFFIPSLSGKDLLPPNEFDWPNPKQIDWPQQNRTWTNAYNLNLIGQDFMPAGEQFTALPPQPIQSNDFRTWIQRTNLLLIPTPPTLVPRPFDWGIGLGPVQPSRFFANSVNLSLIITSAPIPHNQFDWPNPKFAPQPTANRFWGYSYNLNLIGKDKLPVGDMVYDLPPAVWAEAVRERYYDRSYYSGNNPNLLPFAPTIPIVPPPTPPTSSTAQAIPGLEWQYYDRMREPGPIGWR